MIHLKKPSEIQAMKEGGKILAEVLFEVLDHVKPGVSEIELDKLADTLIVKKGGFPGFKKVSGYKHATCISTNDVVVHGIPSAYVLKEGDIIGIDCGVFYKGFHTDMSETVRVQSSKGKVQSDDEVSKFLNTGKRAVEEAIKVAIIGNRIGHISRTLQDIVEKKGGYSVVRSLIGHGVGKNLHEPPEIPGFISGAIDKTPLLQEGMTLAIEVIYNMGGKEVVYANSDGWTIKTKDGSLSGVHERTIAVTKGGPLVLTS